MIFYGFTYCFDTLFVKLNLPITINKEMVGKVARKWQKKAKSIQVIALKINNIFLNLSIINQSLL